MPFVTIEEARIRLPELINAMAPGEAVVITQDDRPIAQLTVLDTKKPTAIPGRCKGQLTIIAEDDEHLKDWAEYLP